MSDCTLIELLYGKSAHANSLACVQDVSFDLAGRRASNFRHSTWQLVSHVSFWMDTSCEEFAETILLIPCTLRKAGPSKPLLRMRTSGRRRSFILRSHLESWPRWRSPRPRSWPVRSKQR